MRIVCETRVFDVGDSTYKKKTAHCFVVKSIMNFLQTFNKKKHARLGGFMLRRGMHNALIRLTEVFEGTTYRTGMLFDVFCYHS